MRVQSRTAPRGRKPLIITISVLVGLLIIAGGASTFFTEQLWFNEVGYGDVFWTSVWVKVALGAIFAAIFAVLMLLNIWIVKKITSPARLFTVPDQILERYRATLQPYTKWAVIGASVVFGIFAGSGATLRWKEWLLFSNQTTFGQVDPVFGKDLGFYVFRLPFHQFLFAWTFSTLIVITLIVGVAHYFMGGIRPQARGDRVAPEVRAHLSVLLGLIVLLKAWGYRLDQFNLLYSSRGTVTGASYTDVNAQLPALRLLVVIAIVCSLFFFVNARVKNWILPLGGIALLALTSVVVGGIYPTAVQRFRVAPNERLREQPYIKRNIDATNQAFGISDVEVRPFTGTDQLTQRAVRGNPRTIENVRLWDPNVLVNSYVQLQRIKQYYEFLEADVDRYVVDGEPRQVMLAAREVSLSQLSGDARTWLNSHLFYTHGYGIVASRVAQVTREGQPDFLVRNIPPEAKDDSLKVTQPRIYFGENEETPFVVVNSEQPELDFPQGDSFETTKYSGTGGIEVKGVLRRAAFAWRFRDVNLLISGAINPESRIMFRRAISERVRQVAPFVQLDSDPYIVIDRGRLVWMIDAYTTTDMYPYAQRVNLGQVSDGGVFGSANYIRNSVKFTIDAENGNIIGYAWDEEDPILKAWMKVFPGLIKPKAELPPTLLAHVRYPEGLFNVQTERYSLYHINDPDNFYSKEDAWNVANDPSSATVRSGRMPSYYVMMRLPEEKDVNFLIVRPFTPGGRQNLTGYMVAHSDPEQYGKIITYQFPKSTNVFGPEQVLARINQDPVVSQQLSLWDAQNSRVIYGNLLIVPIGDSLLYVQPLYLQGGGSNLPELKRVVAVTGENVQMGETLEQALAAIFGAPGAAPEPDGPDGDGVAKTVSDLLAEALDHDRRAQAALRAGDFATYGRQQELMRQKLERAAQAAGAPNPG